MREEGARSPAEHSRGSVSAVPHPTPTACTGHRVGTFLLTRFCPLYITRHEQWKKTASSLPAASFFVHIGKAEFSTGKLGVGFFFFFLSLDLPQNSKRTIFEL